MRRGGTSRYITRRRAGLRCQVSGFSVLSSQEMLGTENPFIYFEATPFDPTLVLTPLLFRLQIPYTSQLPAAADFDLPSRAATVSSFSSEEKRWNISCSRRAMLRRASACERTVAGSPGSWA